MDTSRLYGVELDAVTGRIAQQLYPKANIAVRGYEKTRGFSCGRGNMAWNAMM